MTSLHDLTGTLAANVRGNRQARGWTLDEMAERCGLSRRMIVQIEQGQSNPSIATLLRISDALGLGLPQLVALQQPPKPKVVRSGQGPRLWRGTHGGHAHLVAGSGPPDVLELWDWTLHPAESHSSEAHSPGTVEHLLVISGEVDLRVSDEVRRLLPGDAVSFNGDQPHSYANHPDAEGPARFALSVLQPGVGAATG
ncbi:helix-turn-helix domain-containing protein [Nonomuraea sp. NPDC059023]|uniref:helix-turn-helix domain-containing protein n=1 Tax=unclassified Nonomuraea TaxID=2593643 RepID=UPI0036999AB2